jgi:pimeloyl-ACP methyl ester carboxylesterase
MPVSPIGRIAGCIDVRRVVSDINDQNTFLPIQRLASQLKMEFKRSSMWSMSFPAVALSCVLTVGLTSLNLAYAGPKHAGDSVPRAQSSPIGTEEEPIILTRPLNNAAALPSASRNLFVVYRSKSPSGRNVAVSGTIAIPAGNPPPNGWPLITWTHGTTGMAARCAPSRDTKSGPAHRYLSIIEAMLDSLVKRGYAVVATDYEGLGTPGTQAYLVGVGEGRSAIDIMRAARKIDPSIGTRYVVMGHSQGGHADLFTAAIGPDYAPEFTLLGNVAIAPASHIGELVRLAMTASNPSPILPFIAYTLQSYAAYYPEIVLGRILTPQAKKHLKDTWRGCIDDALASGYWAESIPSEQFLPTPDLRPLLKAAASNEPGALRIGAPTLLIQGTGDATIPPSSTDAVDRDLCLSGNVVSYRIYSEASHEGVLAAAKADLEGWVDARFSGVEAASNCDASPSAATPR